MKKTLPLAVACALAVPVHAQDELSVHVERHVVEAHDRLADATGATTSPEARRPLADEIAASLAPVLANRLAPPRPVKGAPYSADVTTEHNQALADGNVIASKTVSRVFRDGEGRTRQETIVDGEVRSVQLSDPVSGKVVMLQPRTKRAVVLPRVDASREQRDLRVLRLGDREIRIENGKVSLDGKEVFAGKADITVNGKEIRIDGGRVWIQGREVTSGPIPDIVAKAGEGTSADGAVREEVHVRVIRAGDGGTKEITLGAPPLPPHPPVPPVPPGGPHAMRLDGALAKAKGVTTPLGTKEFDGVKADGKSVQQTIPAGEIGNRNPIVVTTETWHSPELQVTVHTRTVDPRFGETIYRLSNIRRGEPAADLFKVPEDYTPAGKRRKG